MGGGFKQELATACLLNKHQDKWQFIFYTTERNNIAVLNKVGIQAAYLDVRSISNKYYCRFSKIGIFRRLLKFLRITESPFEKVFIRDRIDLVYFLNPFSLALFVTKTNYIFTVFDLCHRDHPEFPEVSFGSEFKSRENLLINALPRAIAIVTNFETLKADIVRRYSCDPERIYVLKFLPSMGIKDGVPKDLKEKYSLRDRYIFYPAQFWAHKNHVYILDGLKLLRDKFGVAMDVVFTGSDKGNLSFVLNYAKKLGLESSVRYLGFVPNEEMFSIYKEAIALVMPTYFGPTNIPPLEAFALECPVCYPDLPGLRDQVGNAAFLMDMDNPSSLAQHIITILNEPQTVRAKAEGGKRLLSEWTENDSWDVMNGILTRYARKMRCWSVEENQKN